MAVHPLRSIQIVPPNSHNGWPSFREVGQQQIQSTVKSFVVGISHNYSLPMECDVSDPAAQITRRSSLSSISVYSG